MRVKKRNGTLQEVSFDKITNRLRKLCEMEPKLHKIDPSEIAQKVTERVYDGVTTTELDELSAEQCTQRGTENVQYNVLASRIIISNNHKTTSPSFSETVQILFDNIDVEGNPASLVSENTYKFVMKNKDKLNNYIKYERDYDFDYFGFKTLEKAYLLKIKGKIIERIQDLIMRVSIGIHPDNLKKCLETYDLISQKYFTHATPTLFHSGTRRQQLLSCFLIGVDDSITGMYKALADCAQISKWAGGIGLHIHDIRGDRAHIRSTNGISSGIIPMMKVFNETACHVNQSGRRNGSFAMYLDLHHPDILAFLEAKKNHGDEKYRARDLFYAVWISDLFMKRVKKNEDWSLFCPDKCKGLSELYGEEFERKYIEYESNPGNIVETLPASKIWKEILTSQMETGTPYICYKDAANLKSNQKNLGTIKSSNLCTEIIEYSDHKEYACCTLASINLSAFVEPFDFNTIENIQIYTKKDCEFCHYSKKYMESYNLEYKEIPKESFSKEEEEKFLEELSSKKAEEKDKITYPIILINNKYIGGFNELFKLFKPSYNFKKLAEITHVVTNNLNNVIDINFYPVVETEISNTKHRPLGIGVQGLADVYAKFKYSFDSKEASELNEKMFAVIYHAALEKSIEISKKREKDMIELKKLINSQNIEIPIYYSENFKSNDEKLNKLYHKLRVLRSEIDRESYLGSYSSFIGSPANNGELQFDLWKQEPLSGKLGKYNLNWKKIKDNIQKYGMRNSLLLAPMPTASTSQILGNNECIEPFTSNIYSRSTLAGTFLVINKYLQDDLTRLGIWSDGVKDSIILNNGSVKKLNSLPDVIRNTYKIAWDLSMKSLIDQAADRGKYVCQSQSLNLWLQDPTFGKLSSMHYYSWKKGLKTGIYYLRRRAVTQAQSFSIDPEKEKECLMCSS